MYKRQLFLQRYTPPLLIDEIQYATQLLSYIKIYADTEGQNGDIWLTGSQRLPLMQDVYKRQEVIVYEPAMKEEQFFGSKVLKDLYEFKASSDVIVANRMAKEPVSYTHLDVYKRQIQIG